MQFIRIAALMMALSVSAGALGAHLLKSMLSDDSLKAWNTAVLYMMMHSLAIILLNNEAIAKRINEKRLKIIPNLMLAGTWMFSGSIFLLSTQSIHNMNVAWLGPITPIGGICMIGSWVLLALSIKESK